MRGAHRTMTINSFFLNIFLILIFSAMVFYYALCVSHAQYERRQIMQKIELTAEDKLKFAKIEAVKQIAIVFLSCCTVYKICEMLK